jgi:hypothetical protein
LLRRCRPVRLCLHHTILPIMTRTIVRRPLMIFLLVAVLASPASSQSLWSVPDAAKVDTCNHTPSRGETVQACVTIDRSVTAALAERRQGSVDILLGGALKTVELTSITEQDEQTTILSGRVQGEAFPTFHVAIHQGIAAGSFTVEGQLYEIRPTGDGRSVLTLVDTTQRRTMRSDAVIPEQMPRMMHGPEGAAKGQSSTSIDILLLWDDDIEATYGAAGLAALESSYINYLNMAILNGGNPDITFDVAYSEVIAYDENLFADMGDDLDALRTPGDGILDEAHTLRSQYSADLVHLILPSYKDDTCGIAYQSFSGSNLAFGITGEDGCGVETFAHEIGHNMGMGHDTYVSEEPQDAFQLWSYGYVDLANEINTIMAYPNQCYDNGVNCMSVPYFSDPDAMISGFPMGIPDNPPAKAANNFRVLEETAANRASYSELIDACVADVYSGESGTSSAAQGEDLSFAIAMARNSLSTGCTSNPSFAVYITGEGLDTYLVARETVSLTETPAYQAFSGIPVNPIPPVGTYSVLLFDDSIGGYYILDLQVDITAGSGVNTEDESLPDGYRLVSAWPNPFNPRASVTFQTSGQEAVSIRVYDTLGRERAVLVDGERRTSGEHTVSFDASGLPSGTYLIRMQVGGQSDVMPVTLLK